MSSLDELVTKKYLLFQNDNLGLGGMFLFRQTKEKGNNLKSTNKIKKQTKEEKKKNKNKKERKKTIRKKEKKKKKKKRKKKKKNLIKTKISSPSSKLRMTMRVTL